MKIINKYLVLFYCILLSGLVLGNNVIINNVSRPANDKIKFDISWENSWYANAAPNNWDAVWVFIKAQDCDTDEKAWEHVDISTVSGDHSAASPLQVDAVTDGKGVFVRRAAFGVGNIPTTSVELQLQNSYSATNVNFEVMGIEMVAVLEGSFRVGGGTYTSSSSGSFYYSYSFQNYEITSEAQIPTNALSTPYTSSTTDVGRVPAVPANFPKGYNKFYIMKYEISQEQYVRFLNLLNYSQQVSRVEYDPASIPNSNALSTHSATTIQYRNGIRLKTPATNISPAIYGCDLNGNNVYDEAMDGQSVSCNYLKWTDLLAYLDWSALRPMTELEYEKACRGFGPMVANEYAWGNPSVTPTGSNHLNNTGYSNEISTISLTPNFGLASLNISGTTGPLRTGFAATSSPSRIYAGASYWGVMDLTGNVWEQTVSVGYGNSNTSGFTGILGDGELDGNGEANQANWNLNPVYSVVRGGSWGTALPGTYYYSTVAARYYVNSLTYNNNRHNHTGGRGVRQF